jgi:hypothetical protein
MAPASITRRIDLPLTRVLADQFRLFTVVSGLFIGLPSCWILPNPLLEAALLIERTLALTRPGCPWTITCQVLQLV